MPDECRVEPIDALGFCIVPNWRNANDGLNDEALRTSTINSSSRLPMASSQLCLAADLSSFLRQTAIGT